MTYEDASEKYAEAFRVFLGAAMQRDYLERKRAALERANKKCKEMKDDYEETRQALVDCAEDLAVAAAREGVKWEDINPEPDDEEDEEPS